MSEAKQVIIVSGIFLFLIPCVNEVFFLSRAGFAALIIDTIFLLKNGFSGVIIFVVSCFQGLSVQKSPHEVPQVTTQAVVKSIIYVTVFNLSVTAVVYINQLKQLGVI